MQSASCVSVHADPADWETILNSEFGGDISSVFVQRTGSATLADNYGYTYSVQFTDPEFGSSDFSLTECAALTCSSGHAMLQQQ